MTTSTFESVRRDSQALRLLGCVAAGMALAKDSVDANPAAAGFLRSRNLGALGDSAIEVLQRTAVGAIPLASSVPNADGTSAVLLAFRAASAFQSLPNLIRISAQRGQAFAQISRAVGYVVPEGDALRATIGAGLGAARTGHGSLRDCLVARSHQDGCERAADRERDCVERREHARCDIARQRDGRLDLRGWRHDCDGSRRGAGVGRLRARVERRPCWCALDRFAAHGRAPDAAFTTRNLPAFPTLPATLLALPVSISEATSASVLLVASGALVLSADETLTVERVEGGAVEMSSSPAGDSLTPSCESSASFVSLWQTNCAAVGCTLMSAWGLPTNGIVRVSGLSF